jgi:tetratricopeptide (TPR) repeat protein
MVVVSKELGLLCIVLLLGTSAGWAQTPALTETPKHSQNEEYASYFKEADRHLGKFEFEASLKSCESALKSKPDDFLIRAMMCLDYYEIAERLDVHKAVEKEKKIELYTKMASLAEEGIRLAPDKGECYFMRGLARARMSTTKGVLSELLTAKQIETDWLVAVNRKSDYTTPNGENLQASCCVALGVYYRLCPSFFLLKWLFGINGDLDKSVDYCRKAYELDPTRIEIVKEYGVALITRGLEKDNPKDIESGMEYLRKVPSLPFRLQTDSIDVVHSTMLLKNIKLCPGYSRDEEQDVSEESFKKMQH